MVDLLCGAWERETTDLMIIFWKTQCTLFAPPRIFVRTRPLNVSQVARALDLLQEESPVSRMAMRVAASVFHLMTEYSTRASMILSYIRDARTGLSFLLLLLRNQIFPLQWGADEGYKTHSCLNSATSKRALVKKNWGNFNDRREPNTQGDPKVLGLNF